MSVKENLFALKKRINDFEKKYNRHSQSVSLLAVSKLHPIEKIKEAYEAGQEAFGENYLQEALSKQAALTNEAIEWHFIGHIQSNKTRKIAEDFAWVHSVDSIKIAKRLHEQRPLDLPPLNICIEVNVSDEPAKSGVDLKNVLSIAEYCLSLQRLRLRGLMTIPAQENDFEKQRIPFRMLFEVFQSLREKGIALDTLSMGMSEDFEAAIAEGSTMVRIGTALFGERHQL